MCVIFSGDEQRQVDRKKAILPSKFDCDQLYYWAHLAYEFDTASPECEHHWYKGITVEGKPSPMEFKQPVFISSQGNNKNHKYFYTSDVQPYSVESTGFKHVLKVIEPLPKNLFSPYKYMWRWKVLVWLPYSLSSKCCALIFFCCFYWKNILVYQSKYLPFLFKCCSCLQQGWLFISCKEWVLVK